jgi:hypothetical protein
MTGDTMKLLLALTFSLSRFLLADAQFNPQVEVQARDELASSHPHYPSPWMNPQADGWKEAYVQAKEFVSQLTLLEKVNLTTGVG